MVIHLLFYTTIWCKKIGSSNDIHIAFPVSVDVFSVRQIGIKQINHLSITNAQSCIHLRAVSKTKARRPWIDLSEIALPYVRISNLGVLLHTH